MNMQFVRDLISKIESLPPLPQAARRLMMMSDGDDSKIDIEQMTQIISSDQSLAVKLLQLANSPFYGLTRTITGIRQALMIVGLRGIRHLAMALSVMKFGKGMNYSLPIDIEEFWRHSLAVGLLAKELANEIGYSDPEEAFVAGLIHDVGKVVLMVYFPELYNVVVDRTKKGDFSLFLSEYEILELDHAEVGAELCRHWNLPGNVTQAVAFHHFTQCPWIEETKLRDLCSLVRVSDQIVKITKTGFAGDMTVDGQFMKTAESLKLSIPGLIMIQQKLPKMMSEIEQIFDLKPAPVAMVPLTDQSPRFSIFLEDSQEKGLVSLVLSCMGYRLSADPSLSSFVVADHSLPEDMLRVCENSKIPLLSFSQWKEKNAIQDLRIFPLEKMMAWVLHEVLVSESLSPKKHTS